MRLHRVVAIAAVAAAGLAACGGSDSNLGSSPSGEPTPAGASGDAVRRLRTASETTATVDALSVDLDMEIAVDGRSGGLTLTGVGDSATGAGEFEMSVSAPGLDGGSVYLVTDGTTAWASDDQQQWIELDFADLDQAGASTESASEMLELLESVGEVSVVGEEDIDGAPATHYRADMDLAELLAAQGNAPDADMLDDLGVDSVPLDVWVDERDLVRRIELDFELDLDGSTLAMTMNAAIDEASAPVVVDGPPAGEIVEGDVTDLGELIAG